MLTLLVSVAASLAAQDPALLLCAADLTRAPEPVSCGLLEPVGDGRGGWRPVEIAGSGAAVAGVLVKRPFGSAVRAVLPPGLPKGERSLRVARGRPGRLPEASLVLAGGGAVWESGGFRARFDATGAIEVGDAICALHPARARAGSWTERDRDPVRCVLAWEAPAEAGRGARAPLRLYATLHAGVPEVGLTLVVTGSGALPEALGFELRPADQPDPAGGAEPDAESLPADSRPAEPPPGPGFEEVFEDLRSSAWETVPVAGCAIGAVVRRHGAVAPAAVEGPPGAARRLLAIAREESLAAGETRALRVRLDAGKGGVDVLARPAAFPDAFPGLGRLQAASRCRDLARLRRKLDAAIGVFRADPRHGLLHERGDLGDWKLDAFRFGNLEWDTALGFLLRFLDRGDRLDAWQAIAGVEHLLLCDRDRESGLFFQHGRGHQSGLVEAGHHWAEGVAAVASWLDDPWLLDACRDLADDQVAAYSKMELASALPRSLGWALTALCALHGFGTDRDASLKLIRRLERFVLGRQNDSGHFMIERSTAQDGAFRVSPFVDGGILLPALERTSRVTRNALATEAVRRARAALLRDAVVVETDGPRLVSSVLIDPRSGRVLSRAGSAEGEEVVLFLSGVGGGGAVETGLLRRAEESLTLDARNYLGKGISMLMRALPAYAARSACR